jgi:hypothetical protein
VQNVTEFRDKTKKSQTDFFLHDFNQLGCHSDGLQASAERHYRYIPGFVIATVIRKFTDAQADSRDEK